MRMAAVAIWIALALPAYPAWAAQDIRWLDSLEEAQAASVRESRPILLHFTAEWCRPCQQMNRFVFANSQVVDAVNSRVIPVRVDIDRHPELVRKYSISDIPAEVFIRPDGTLITRSLASQSASDWLRNLDQALRTCAALEAGGEQAAATRNQMAELQRTWEQQRESAVASAAGEQPFDIPPFHMQPHFATGATSSAHQGVVGGAVRTTSTRFSVPDADPAAQMDRAANPPPGTDAANLRITPQASGSYAGVPAVSHPEPVFAGGTPEAQQHVAQPGMSGDPAVIRNPFRPETGMEGTAGRGQSAAIESAPAAELRQFMPPQPAVAMLEPQPSRTGEESEPLLCLDGYCPVTLLAEGRAARGLAEIGCIHRGRVYLFASEENRQQFLTDPDRWSPLLAGFDPVIFERTGELVAGRREFGTFMVSGGNQSIVLFASAETRDAFQAAPAPFLAKVEETVRHQATARRE